jgi:glycosyltransferase involved in cell wall biosynthesis
MTDPPASTWCESRYNLSKRIVFLYTSLNGFVLSTIRALFATTDVASIDVVHWSSGSTSGNEYKIEPSNLTKFIKRTEISDSAILEMLETTSPNLIYVSGWMDWGYVKAVRQYKKSNPRIKATVVCGIDDQWRGSLRQILGSIYFRLRLRQVFDLMWVSGMPQYHFARQFGYPDRKILAHLLSADTAVFKPVEAPESRFIFVGRFEAVKGLDLLVAAYAKLSDETRAQWPLLLVGAGSLKDHLENKLPSGARVVPYLQPVELALELSKGGVGCQPSLFEPWGVSIHELAAMGYPLIVSSACGASSEFVIHGHNGYVFSSGDVSALSHSLHQMTLRSPPELQQFGAASFRLSQRISPLTCARSFLSADAPWRA